MEEAHDQEVRCVKRCLVRFVYASVGLLIVILIVIAVMHSRYASDFKESAIEHSQYGFSYKINEYEYVDEKKDKPTAVAALQKRLSSVGVDYSIDQLNKLPTHFVILILETQDARFRAELFTMIPRFMHADYDKAVELVNKTFDNSDDVNVLGRNIKSITPDQTRMVYDVVQEYPFFKQSSYDLSPLTIFHDFKYCTIPPKDKLMMRYKMYMTRNNPATPKREM